jgi:uncharacterized protein YbjT (DUF2867 family)
MDKFKSKLLVLVVGATGSIGQLVVKEALHQGHRVRALARNRPASAALPKDIEIVIGDLTKPATLSAAVADIDAIVFTHGTYGSVTSAESVDYGGVLNVLMALERPIGHIALMTAIAVTDRKGAHDWKRRAERLVRMSGNPYTVVRPGWFDYNNTDEIEPVFLQGDTRQSGTPRDGVIARRQVARVLVSSLTAAQAAGKTFELVAQAGDEPDTYAPLFGMLDSDTTGTLDGAHDRANMALDKEPAAIRQALDDVKRRSRKVLHPELLQAGHSG